MAAALAVALVSPAVAQSPSTGGWDTGTRIDAAPPKSPGPANTTTVPRTPGDARTPSADISLQAFLTDDGQVIGQGLIWHVFEDIARSAEAAQPPRPVGSWRDATPSLKLPPGTYFVTAAFGKAHLTRRITLKAGANPAQRFVLNAGGLRIAAVLASGEPLPEMTHTIDVLAGDIDPTGARPKILGSLKPGLIVRLNAGIYQIVSTYGDANSVIRSDVTVEAGKLTEATVTHHAAKVTFKLVTRPGGEAMADTQWTLQSPGGEQILEGRGALPTHILASGAYVIVARNNEQAYQRSFVVNAGPPVQIEIVIPTAGR
jgi:hypothetical protein